MPEPQEMAEEDALTEEDALLNPEQEAAEAVAQEQRQFALAFGKIKALTAECAEGRSDREAEALGLAKRWPALVDHTKLGFAKARADWAEATRAAPKPRDDHGGLFRPGLGRPRLIEAKVVEAVTSTEAWVRKTEEAFSSPPAQPEEVAQPEEEPKEPSKELQTEVAQPQSEFGFSPPTELPLPEAIKAMNDKHAVISNLGGKCVTMEWTPSLIMPGTKELAYQSFSSFRERYANRYVDCGMGMGRANLGAVWLAHPQRRQYEGLDLVPNGAGVLPGGYLNLWPGWGVEPRKGSWRRLQRHVAEVLANGNQEFEDYIKRWTAWKLQNAGLPPEVVVALLGGKGAGKGAWGYTLMLIFGAHGLQIYASEHLTGKHNAHLQNKLFLFLDEAIWAGDREAEKRLKGLTTEKWMFIEPKNINGFQWVNRLGMYMSGNDKWIVPASHDERRYAVNKINERWKQDKSYFGPLFEEINNGGAAAMLYDLLQMDLDGWHPRENVPQTKALLDQKMQGLTGLEQWYVHLLSVGELPSPSPKNPRWVLARFLLENAKAHSLRNKYTTSDDLAEFLKEIAGCTHKSNGQAWGWIFPPLIEARQSWLTRAGKNWEWLAPDITDWGEKQ
jgi:hypothetical protein